MRTLHALFVVVASLAAASCTKTNPDFCDDGEHRCPDGFVCNANNACDEIGGEACTTSSECLDALAPYCVPGDDGLVCSEACDTSDTCADVDPDHPYCVDSTTASDVCGACIPADNTGCAAASDNPICDAAALDCRGCAVDDECASAVCLPSGACAAEAGVLYATPTGSGSACSLGEPCLLPDAVANIGDAGRTTIKLLPYDGAMFSAGTGLTLDTDVTIIATGTTINRDGGGSGPVARVQGGADITIFGGSWTGGDDADGRGFWCSNSSTLAISRNATVFDNDDVGIYSDGCVLTVDDSTVSGNTGGGIAVANGSTTTRLINNFVYGNGAPGAAGSTFGGINYSGGASTIVFNSIVENFAKTGVSGGILCDESTLTAKNNIVVENSTGAFGQENGLCGFADSIFPAAEVFAGTTTNITDIAPTFSDPANQNYHLAAGSSGIDIGATVAGITTDIDGDLRDATPDIGADEFVP